MLHVDPTNLSVDATVADAAGSAQVRALVEQEVAMLTRLAQIGLNIAEAVERQAVAQAQIAERAAETGAAASEVSAVLGQPGVVYQRVARAVRLTLALRAKAVKELMALDQGQALARQARDKAAEETAAEADPVGRRRGRIDRIVRRVIEAEEADEDEVERLSGEAWERLIDEDVYGDVMARPIGEIVARVCEDLGLSPDWNALAREAWAVEEAASGAPGSPFVARAGPQSASP